MNTVYMICGLPGAGKTTIAKQIEAENRALRFSLDEWLITLFGRYEITPETHQTHVQRVLGCREIIWTTAERALKLGVDVILDDGFFFREHRAKYRAMIEHTGAKPKLYFVDVNAKTLLTRLQNRNSDLPTNNFAISNELMTYFFSLFEPPTEDEEIEIVRINKNLIDSQNVLKNESERFMTQQLLDVQTLSLPFALNIRSIHLNEEVFEHLCNDNPDLNLELTAKGELIIMPSTGYESGWRNSDLNYYVAHWAKENNSGKVFDSSTVFTLPNDAKRSPDVSWISDERIEALPVEDRKGFAHIVPDFVIELRSPSDSMNELKEKMVEYIENGVRLGWLIDPLKKQVCIYRSNREPETLDDPEELSGEDVLQGFVLNVREIW